MPPIENAAAAAVFRPLPTHEAARPIAEFQTQLARQAARADAPVPAFQPLLPAEPAEGPAGLLAARPAAAAQAAALAPAQLEQVPETLNQLMTQERGRVEVPRTRTVQPGPETPFRVERAAGEVNLVPEALAAPRAPQVGNAPEPIAVANTREPIRLSRLAMLDADLARLHARDVLDAIVRDRQARQTGGVGAALQVPTVIDRVL